MSLGGTRVKISDPVRPVLLLFHDILLINIISFLQVIHFVFFGGTGTPTKGLSGSQDSDKGVCGTGADRQFTVFVSEKQARLVSLPSQTCLYKQQICETSFVIKAEITTVKGTTRKHTHTRLYQVYHATANLINSFLKKTLLRESPIKLYVCFLSVKVKSLKSP